MEERKEIELQDDWAVILLPTDAIAATINIKVYHDDELIDVYTKLNAKDIQTAFRKAEEGYIDEDAKFVLSDEAREWLDKNGGDYIC